MSIGPEPLFTLDDFQKPATLTERESIAQMILNLFLMRPGNLPGQPHIGINIQQYLYKLEGDFDPEEIKQKIYMQCSELMSFVSIGDVRIFATDLENGEKMLIVQLPIGGIDESTQLYLGFKKEQGGDVSHLVQFQDAVKNL